MKKLLTGLIGTGLFLSLNTFAFTPDCANCGYASGLAAPKYPGGFSIGVSGFYIQPSESAFGLITDSWQYIDGPDVLRAQSKPFDPDHDWAWGINLGYDIPCTSYGIAFDYYHFDNKTHAVNGLADGPVSFASIFFPSPVFPISETGLLTALVSDAFLHYDFDQADLKVTSQYNDVCGHFQVRPGVGLRYGKVKHRLSFSSPATLVTGPVVSDALFNGEVRSKFDGIGPLASVDARYGFGGGFGVVGHFDGALLVGEVDISSFIAPTITVVAGLDPLPPPSTVRTEFHVPHTDRVVGSFSGKLGVDYSFCFCNKSSLTLEAGYQAIKYYDAIDILQGAFSTPDFRVTDTVSGNFFVKGPYINATYHL